MTSDSGWGWMRMMMMVNDIVTVGNTALLGLPKSAYFCSERFQPSAVFASYDWAKQMRSEKHCVISGFQSRIESDVLEILLRENSPVILVLARSIYRKIPVEYQSAVDKGNMLILSPFPAGVYRVNSKTSYKRNCWIMQNTDNIVIGSLTSGGNLERAVKTTGKNPTILADADNL